MTYIKLPLFSLNIPFMVLVRLLFLVAICFLHKDSCQAQANLQYGFSSGFNRSLLVDASGRDNDNFRPSNSPSLGAFLNIGLPANLSVRLGMGYQLNGGLRTEVRGDSLIKERFGLHYFTLPFQFRYTFRNFLLLQAGGYWSRLNRAFVARRRGLNNERNQLRNPSRERIEFIDLRDNFYPFDYGLMFGLGFQWADGFSLQLHYHRGLASVFKNAIRRNRVFTLSLDYSINYAQKKTQQFENRSRHSFFVELGGHAVMSSLNYDYIFYQHQNLKLSFRTGIGAAPLLQQGWAMYWPNGLMMLLGRKKHYLELGFVHDFVLDPQGLSSIGAGNFGYRFQQPEGGLFLRLTYTPLVSAYDVQRFQHWAGLSIGWTMRATIPRNRFIF